MATVDDVSGKLAHLLYAFKSLSDPASLVRDVYRKIEADERCPAGRIPAFPESIDISITPDNNPLRDGARGAAAATDAAAACKSKGAVVQFAPKEKPIVVDLKAVKVSAFGPAAPAGGGAATNPFLLGSISTPTSTASILSIPAAPSVAALSASSSSGVASTPLPVTTPTIITTSTAPTLNTPITVAAASTAPVPASGLTAMRKNCPPVLLQNHAFSSYAQFSGDGAASSDAMHIYIYVPFAAEAKDRETPLEIKVLTTATVRETIGYILCRYTALGRQPQLMDDLTAYELRVAEDSGEADMDLPPLDPTQPIVRFEFDSLCLCQVANFTQVVETSSRSRFLRIFYEETCMSILSRKQCGNTIGEVLQQIVRRRLLRHGAEFIIELENEPGVELPTDMLMASLDARLGDPKTIDLRILRKYSKRRVAHPPASAAPAPSLEFNLRLFSSQTFSVVRVQRFGGSVPAELFVSTERLEIRAYARTGPFTKQQKLVIIPMEHVRHCAIRVDERPNAFRMVATVEGDEKIYDFEAKSPEEAGEISSKIGAILSWRLEKR